MSTVKPPRMIVGIGNAGVTVLDLLSVGNPSINNLLAVNNDPESLASSVVAKRITVPEGDPGKGFLAIDGEFEKAVSGISTILLCGGLGGETASFLLPALAIHAKSSEITTITCVGMPFSFEGRQKREAAEAALEKLRTVCDAIVVIDNDRLSGGTPSTSAIGEAFGLSDSTLVASLLALWGMLSTSGPVKITRADLHAVLGIPGSVTHFGFGSSRGANRLHEALEKALKSPLLLSAKGASLREAKSILLFLRGPTDLSFAEVQLAVAGIERVAGEGCQIKVGVQADGSEGSPLELFIITSSGGSRASAKNLEVKSETADLPDLKPSISEQTPSTHQSAPAAKQAKLPSKPASKQTQGTLDLNPQQRGRFDKSERTIVNGEDLDVPTFIRKGIKLTSPPRT